MITQHSVKEEKQKLCNENAKSIFSKVLFIGIDYHHPRGGVAAVEYVYSQWIHPFKFVATTVAGNKMVKLLVFFRAVFLFVWKLLWDRQIRIIHVHGASDASFWRKRIFILIAKAFKKRIIYHCHGAEFKRFASQHHHAVQSLLKKCNSIIALSDSWKEWFQNTFDCKNVIVIKNIIPEPKMEKGSKYQDKPDLCTLLFLGRLGKRKGIYDLIDVIADNRSCYEGRIKLWIGGDGESENVLKNVPKSEGASYPQSKKEVFDLVPPGGCWRDLPEDVARAYMKGSYNLGGGKTGMARRISWDEPSLTILCSPCMKQTDRCHPDETRPFTVRESARIQSFPDAWQFCGNLHSKY